MTLYHLAQVFAGAVGVLWAILLLTERIKGTRSASLAGADLSGADLGEADQSKSAG